MNWGDSGAIIVGAGSANTQHGKLNFSTYGSRVNVQGWGQSVMTAGYGSFATIGGDPNQNYTSTFSGTSSASPMIAASTAAIQSVHRALTGRNLTSQQIRQLLIETGVPQGSGGHIGPHPNVTAAIQVMAEEVGGSGCQGAQPIGEGETIIDGRSAIGIGTPDPACAPPGSEGVFQLEAWFLYEANCTGTLSISACAGVIESIGVYGAACPATSGEAIACDLDSCPAEPRPFVTLPVAQGELLHIRAASRAPLGQTESALVITCAAGLLGDLNGDGIVNGADLGILLSNWSGSDPLSDLNSDGVVNGADLGILLGQWSS